MKLSVVILTLGDRPVELERAVHGALRQVSAVDQEGEGIDVEVVLVGNGVDVPGTWPQTVTVVRLPDNLGIPAGRNRGVEASSGEIIIFLDDDGWYESPALGAHLRDLFTADPALGVVSFRVRDPDGGPGERRHVPRLRAGNPLRSSDVTTFLGGACAIRRAAFDAAGGLPEGFFYAHEETDLAWQALNAGYRIIYDSDSVMFHPALPPTRHEMFYRLNARNRVWLARRNLPWPVAFVYLTTWVAMTVARERRPAALRPWFGGFREGWRRPAGPRRPISWRTVWRMTRLGRPPVI